METVRQKYTSAATSINSAKAPKLYGMVAPQIDEEGNQILDYGCGRYFDNYDTFKKADVSGYDPYNRPDETVLHKHFDFVLCSNVLNVIAESEVRQSVLEQMKELGDTVLISVYEGDRSGKARQTKPDCYQLNRNRGDYIPELVNVFGKGNVTYKRGGYFECKGE